MKNKNRNMILPAVITAALAVAIMLAYGGNAHAADNVIDLGPLAKFVGKFVHGGEYNNSTKPPFMYAQVYPRGSDKRLSINAKLPEDDQRITITLIADSLPNLTKATGSFRIANRHSGPDSINEPTPPDAMVEYQGRGMECSAIGGTLKVTAFGKVDGFVTGTIEGLKWSGHPNCQKFPAKGSFSVQRSIDWEF